MSSKTKKERRSFTEEFKRDAVDLVVKEGYSKSAASRAVDVTYSVFDKWYNQYAPEPEPCGPDATVEELQSEVQRLRKQLRLGIPRHHRRVDRRRAKPIR